MIWICYSQTGITQESVFTLESGYSIQCVKGSVWWRFFTRRIKWVMGVSWWIVFFLFMVILYCSFLESVVRIKLYGCSSLRETAYNHFGTRFGFQTYFAQNFDLLVVATARPFIESLARGEGWFVVGITWGKCCQCHKTFALHPSSDWDRGCLTVWEISYIS